LMMMQRNFIGEFQINYLRIMKSLLLVAIVALSLSCAAQKEIKLEQLKDYIGDSVKVQGVISGVRFLDGAKNTPTFINVGGAYPDQLLTIVIWGDVRKALVIVPTPKDAGNKIIVSGKVELYNGKPQIVVKNPRQFQIIQDAQKELELP